MYLLPLLLLCHFAADFTPLSTRWMLNAKYHGRPVFPILIHGIVHGLLMFLVCVSYTTTLNALLIFLFQTVTHTVIDIGKGRITASNVNLESIRNPMHWVLFGVDQLLHQIVIVLIFYYILYNH
ncbi:DUF3307 domain-containing protein [Chitinophaga sp. Hz27]|uniref:DUF3307 domain-containing protein n=1 Tax=Chitinophaga sp. Hz27 TaxID=3347169 RepID=UPI0035DD3CCB